MCYAHQFSREGSLCVREAEEMAPDPWSAFTSSISTTLVAPVIAPLVRPHPESGVGQVLRTKRVTHVDEYVLSDRGIWSIAFDVP
jgi:hypothetical protein